MKCSNCSGSGLIEMKKCYLCKGTGKISLLKRFLSLFLDEECI